jgi:hypothetical protein
MYGRSGQLDTYEISLSFFVGATLTQICLGEHDLGLNFSLPSIQIMMQSGFGVRAVGQEIDRHDLTLGHLLRGFLNRDVSGAKWAKMGTLELTFAGGDQVLVFDDSDQFESYTISVQGQTIVV